jgi:hypothetical protein
MINLDLLHISIYPIFSPIYTASVQDRANHLSWFGDWSLDLSGAIRALIRNSGYTSALGRRLSCRPPPECIIHRMFAKSSHTTWPDPTAIFNISDYAKESLSMKLFCRYCYTDVPGLQQHSHKNIYRLYKAQSHSTSIYIHRIAK